MPSISERLRQPLDESMLLRLVLVSGLMRGTDLAKFYAEGGGGLDGSRSLEDFLAANGVDVEQLKVLKRAYVETRDFGTTLLEFLRSRHARPDQLRELQKTMTLCETEQLVQIRRGQTPLPIGEMLVERGLLTREDLGAIIQQQGMSQKIERYTSEVRQRATVAGRLRLQEFRSWARANRGAPLLLVSGLVLVVLLNLWIFGAFQGSVDPFGKARTPAGHIANLKREHARMLAEARRRQYGNAEFHRGRLGIYFRRLAEAKIRLEDPDVRHIRETLEALDFERTGDIPPRELLSLSSEELERRLMKKP